jgi:peptidoglycan/LPS O-acetylase OafA/YrhL
LKLIFGNFINKFRRETYSGNYLPEIDGLRFIAIFLVVGVFHLFGQFVQDIFGEKLSSNIYVKEILLESSYGVPLFFIISGFIVSLPFAKQKLCGGNLVSLKAYFIRRITRIEPLYIITLILYFVARVWVFKYQSFSEIFPHFISSLFYAHSLTYHSLSIVNGVTWSLEVEIQFYMMAPLITSIFLIANKNIRWFIFGICIVGGCIYSSSPHSNDIYITAQLCYFFSGMFLAELYITVTKKSNHPITLPVAIIALLVILFMPTFHNIIFKPILLFIKLFSSGVFIFLALNNDKLKHFLSKSIFSIPGGMCYSIYLLHEGVYGILRHKLYKIEFFKYRWLNALLAYGTVLAAIFFVSAIFFFFIEKPTMKKNWWRRERKMGSR